MERRARRREVEDRIHAIAGRQHGLVTRAQLLEVGLSPAAVGRRLQAGRLRALHRGVYLLGPLPHERTVDMAAVLAGGPTALLSHTSALRLWRIRESDVARPIHVTVASCGRGRRPGIRFHRVAALAEDEHSVVDGVPTTSAARALVDAAGILGTGEIERAAAVAEREGIITSHELAELPRRYRRRPGIAAIRAIVEEGASPAFTRSEAERRCLALLRAAGLPRPQANVPVGPYELDLLWPSEGVAIEIDGRTHHSSRPRFEGDRRKDNWLRARGIEVIRLTWRQITRDAFPTAVQIGQILALARLRRPAAAPAPASSQGEASTVRRFS